MKICFSDRPCGLQNRAGPLHGHLRQRDLQDLPRRGEDERQSKGKLLQEKEGVVQCRKNEQIAMTEALRVAFYALLSSPNKLDPKVVSSEREDKVE